jgi:hypothetical protein
MISVVLILFVIIFIIIFVYLKINKVEKYYNYISDLGNNDSVVNLFCKKIRQLDTPNENNILYSKFYDEVILKNDKEIKDLEDKINKINKEEMMKYVDKKNLHRLKTHLNTKKQLNAIENSKKNINSNNRLILNLT